MLICAISIILKIIVPLFNLVIMYKTQLPFAIAILSLYLVTIQPAVSQDQVVFSANSRVFAHYYYAGKEKDSISVMHKGKVKTKRIVYYTFVINVYQTKSQLWLQSLSFESESKHPISNVVLSDDGNLLFAKQDNDIRIWDTRNGFLIDQFTAATAMAFQHLKDNYAIAKVGYGDITITILNSYDSDKKFSLTVPRHIDTIDSLAFSPNDSCLVAFCPNNYLVFWRCNIAKPVFKRSGNEVHFPNDDLVAITERDNNRLVINTFKMPLFTRVSKIEANKILKLGLGNKGEVIGQFTRKSKNDLVDIEPVLRESGISNNGRFFVLKTLANDTIPALVIYDCVNNTVRNVLHPYNLAVSGTYYPYRFKNDNILLLGITPINAVVVNLDNNSFSQALSFMFSYTRNERTLTLDDQLEYRRITPDWKYCVIEEQSWTRSVTYFRSTAIEQTKSKIENVRFKAFSPNSRYMVLQNKDAKLAVINVSDIDADLNDGTDLPLHLTSDTIAEPNPEEIIAEDGAPPPGYDYVSMKKIILIDSVINDTIMVNLHLKTIEIGDSITGIQVHLLDDEGNYYYGASDAQWRYIWRNLLLQSVDGSIKQVKDFEVSEFFGADTLPTAIVLVLDHSGSMGEQRASVLQSAAELYIQNKRTADGIAIIKYDNKVAIETPLTSDKKRLLKDVKIEGLRGYGGATALLDGINRGVQILGNATGYGRRSIVILTDGNENASNTTKGQVIKNANLTGVNVFTVGFGDYISEDYLKAIASYTEGTYYHIFNTSDFRWIFGDIDKRMRYYYTIQFKTDTIGKHTTLLEIALDENRRDSLVTTFNNKPVDYENLDNENPDEETAFVPQNEEVKLSEFDNPVFEKFIDSIKVVEEKLEIRNDSIKKEVEKIRTEFASITLPNIQFVFDEVTIINGSEKGIDDVVNFMQKYPTITMAIHGHTDNVGTDERNTTLSLNRANKVKELLVVRGITGSRISTAGFGATRPLTTNDTDEGRGINRRVEFIPDMSGVK